MAHSSPSDTMDTQEVTKTDSSSTTSKPSRPPSAFVLTMRKIYKPLGFSKGYNFPLFVIFGGALLGFSLARLPYINVAGSSSSSFRNSAPLSEWYSYRQGIFRVGLILHLSTILPAGILIPFQFLPVIRYKLLLLHRLTGYLIIILILLSHIGAIILAPRSFGGGLDVQAGIGTLVIISSVSIGMAYWNIKRLQIDQHRAWMLRGMFYMGTIITLRLIMVISMFIIASLGGYYQVMSCDKLVFLHDGNNTEVSSLYPTCANASESYNPHVAVEAQLVSGREEGVAAGLGLSFGMAMWLSIMLHVFGVEVYLGLTGREAERLRNVSYERQLEAGFKRPGSAGLVADRWGDEEEWRPKGTGKGESAGDGGGA